MSQFNFRFAAVVASLLVACTFPASVAAQALDVIEPGTLTIAFTGDMPGTGYQDGKMVGYDGEILQRADMSRHEAGHIGAAAGLAGVETPRIGQGIGLVLGVTRSSRGLVGLVVGAVHQDIERGQLTVAADRDLVGRRGLGTIETRR